MPASPDKRAALHFARRTPRPHFTASCAQCPEDTAETTYDPELRPLVVGFSKARDRRKWLKDHLATFPGHYIAFDQEKYVPPEQAVEDSQ